MKQWIKDILLCVMLILMLIQGAHSCKQRRQMIERQDVMVKQQEQMAKYLQGIVDYLADDG